MDSLFTQKRTVIDNFRQKEYDFKYNKFQLSNLYFFPGTDQTKSSQNGDKIIAINYLCIIS